MGIAPFNNKNLSLYPSELAAIRHYAANCDSQDVPAYQADDGYAKRGAPRSHHFSTIANIEEDSPGVDPPWNRRRCRGWICRLLHGPKAHRRQADASFSPEQKGLDCAVEGQWDAGL